MDDFSLQDLLDAQPGYEQPSMDYTYSTPDLSALDGLDFSSLLDSSGGFDLSSILGSGTTSLPDMSFDPNMNRGLLSIFRDPASNLPATSYTTALGTPVTDLSNSDLSLFDTSPVQNPYDYMTGEDGTTYIQDIRNGDIIGWVDDNLQNRYYLDERMSNNVAAGRPALYSGAGVRSGPTVTGGYQQDNRANRDYLASQSGGNSQSGNPQLSTRQALQGALSLAQMLGGLGALTRREGVPRPQARGTASVVNWNSPTSRQAPKYYAQGGHIGGLNRFVNQGAMNTGHHGIINGNDGGQSDRVDIKASPGEYIFDAETVSALGDGNTAAGAKKLDGMRENIRKHKRSAEPHRIAPAAKEPSKYLKD